MIKTDVVKLVCLLCGRHNFYRKTPHRCVGGYRKRNIVWAILYQGTVWRFKKKKRNPFVKH